MYAQLGDAYRAGNPAAFNQDVDSLAGWLAEGTTDWCETHVIRVSF